MDDQRLEELAKKSMARDVFTVSPSELDWLLANAKQLRATQESHRDVFDELTQARATIKVLIRICERLTTRVAEAIRLGASGIQFEEGQSAVKEAREIVAKARGGSLGLYRKMAVFSVRKSKSATTWVHAGNATVNRDGSINVYLDVLPLDGELHLREGTPDTINTEAKRAKAGLAHTSTCDKIVLSDKHQCSCGFDDARKVVDHG